MSFVLLILLTVMGGALLLAAGGLLYWKRPSARPGAVACMVAGVLLQFWWIALAALAFFKLVVLRQDT